MKWLKYTSIFLFVACNEPSRNTEHITPDLPKILQQDKRGSIKSYRGEDLIENIYLELLDKNELLHTIHDSVQKQKNTLEELKNRYIRYNSKSDEFYATALKKIDSIKDSSFKKEAQAFLDQSKKDYDAKKDSLVQVLTQLTRTDTILQNQFIIHKIKCALVEIEKYQSQSKPVLQPYDEFLLKQQSILQQLKDYKP